MTYILGKTESANTKQDEIIRMARDVGLGTDRWTTEEEFHDFLERFAWIITAHEREACAKVCEDVNDAFKRAYWDHENGAYQCAAAIRARGNNHG